MNADQPSCFSCRFSVSDTDDEDEPVLRCYRYPPLVVMFDDEPVSMRPLADEWCGEHAS